MAPLTYHKQMNHIVRSSGNWSHRSQVDKRVQKIIEEIMVMNFPNS